MNNKPVFISYSSKNKPIADAICHILEEHGILCWIAPRDVLPGETWARNIVRGIRECDLMVLVYTADSNASSHVANEVDRAFSFGKTIIPFLVDTTPMNEDFDYYLSRKHWLVAYPDYKNKLKPLVEVVAKNLGLDLKEYQSQKEKEEVQANVNPDYTQEVEEARLAMSQYKVDQAVEKLLVPSLAGDEKAQCLLSSIVGVTENLSSITEETLFTIKREADSGNSFAQYIMGRYHMANEVDYDKAYHYIEASANKGDGYGIYEQARAYEFGTGVDKDMNKSKRLYMDATAKGAACSILFKAKNNLFGWTIERNPTRAIQLLEKCMQLDIPESYNVMGDIYWEGEYVERDLTKAEELYNKAIERGYPQAYNSLSYIYICEPQTYEFKSIPEQRKGIAYIRKGASLGVPSCIALMAQVFYVGYGEVPEDKEKALRWYIKAAKAGDRYSIYMVGYMHYYGEGCKENNAEAWKWFKHGASLMHNGCLYYLGKMCLDGYGQEGKEPKDCIEYFEKAEFSAGTDGEEGARKLYELYRSADLESSEILRSMNHELIEYDWLTKDNIKAMKHLKRAADLGTFSKNSLLYGLLLSNPDSPFADELEGIKYLESAYNKGEMLAAVKLGDIYKEGIIVEKDVDRAVALYQEAADAEEPMGNLRLGSHLLENSKGDGVFPFLKSAYASGITQALDEMTQLLRFVGEEEQREIIRMHYEAANKQYLPALMAVGIDQFKGENGHLNLDIKEVIAYNKTAARYGSGRSAFFLGEIFNHDLREEDIKWSDLVKKNPAVAYYWYQLAKGKKNIDQDQLSKTLSELSVEGHRFALEFESEPSFSKLVQYLQWVFPWMCDERCFDYEWTKIFNFANYTGSENGTTPNQDEKDRRYLPSTLQEILKDYEELKSLGDNFDVVKENLPELTEDECFPFVPLDKLRQLAMTCYYAWLHVRNISLRKASEEFGDVTLAPVDQNRMVDMTETMIENENENWNIQMLILSIISMMISLENLYEDYRKLYNAPELLAHLNDKPLLVSEEYIKRIADMFYLGTKNIPRSYYIAKLLYQHVTHDQQSRERYWHCKNMCDDEVFNLKQQTLLEEYQNKNIH